MKAEEVFRGTKLRLLQLRRWVVSHNPYTYYKLRFIKSRYSVYVTVIVSLIVVAFYFLFIAGSSGSYLVAWYLSLSLAVLALLIMSMPRFIKITNESIEIHCVVDLTLIPFTEIESIEKVSFRSSFRFFPLIASLGFLGFFGYYLDLKHFRLVRVYATSMRRLVMIATKRPRHYLVSVENPDEFIEMISFCDIRNRTKYLSNRNNKI